jgi:hypothetical protein
MPFTLPCAGQYVAASASLRAFAAHRGDATEQRNHVCLAFAAGFLEHARNLHPNSIRRNAAVPGETVNGFPGGKTTSNAGFGRCEIEQRHYQFRGGRSWCGHGHQHENGGAAGEDIARGKSDRHDMTDRERIRSQVTNRKRTDAAIVVQCDPGHRLGKHSIGAVVFPSPDLQAEEAAMGYALCCISEDLGYCSLKCNKHS